MPFDSSEAQKYLEGVDYPVSKQDLIQVAEANGAPQEMIDDLQTLGQEQVRGPADVEEALAARS